VSKKLQADLIAEVRRIASDLGRTPTRDEFRQHSKIGEKVYRSVFGGFMPMLMASGLKVYAEKRDAPVLELKPEHIKFDTKLKKPSSGISSRKILVLGDCHFPWVNLGALSAVYLYIESHPEITDVVQIGDLYDLFSWAKFPRSHLVIKPDEEIARGRKMAEEMWAKIRELLPAAKRWRIIGNHDIRPLKRVLEVAPELEVFVELRKWFEFEGVATLHDPKEWLEIGPVSFTHGHLTKLGAHSLKYQRNVVCGHSHRGGVFFYHARQGEVLWELNCGYLGDANARPLLYREKRQEDWTLGFGVIDEWGPRFISL